MTKEQRRYAISDKELLAIILALEEWKHFLIGCKHKVEILTDHQNLTYFKTKQHLNARQSKMGRFLTRF